MTLVADGTDEWIGRFVVDTMGWHEYALVSWVDRFKTWRRDLQIKAGAGQEIAVELLEGSLLLREAASRAAAASADADSATLLDYSDRLSGDMSTANHASLALDDELAALMESTPIERTRPSRRHCVSGSIGTAPDSARGTRCFRARRARVRSGAARFAPRPPNCRASPISASTSCTFRPFIPSAEAFERDRTITRSHRPRTRAARGQSGPKKAVTQPSSPDWARSTISIAFRQDAERLGLEVALDLAWQCSPDHPWVREHPEWFRHRPDGTIKYAENPPKKYQDIYPLDFESDGLAGALARAARGDAVLDRAWGDDIPRRQSAHENVRLLGMADRARPRASIPTSYSSPRRSPGRSRCSGWRSSASASRIRTSPGAIRRQELTDYFTELTKTEGAGVSAAEPVRKHARHPARVSAARRSAGVRGPSRARGDAGSQLRHLQRIRAVRRPRGSRGQRGNPTRKSTSSGTGTGTSPAISTSSLPREPNPPRTRRAPVRLDRRVLATDNPEVIAYTKRAPDDSERLLMIINLDPHHMQHGFVGLDVDADAYTSSATCSTRDVYLASRPELRAVRPRCPPGAHLAHRREALVATTDIPLLSMPVEGASPALRARTTILSGTRTRSFIRRTSSRSSTATTTASATFRDSPNASITSRASASPVVAAALLSLAAAR